MATSPRPLEAGGSRPARRLADVLALTKPRITAMSVLTAVAGLVLAPGEPGGLLLAALIAGMALLVGSASTLNMYLERDVDGLMERTRDRPLPAGRLPASFALRFGLAQAAGALSLLGIGGNLLAASLGALALVLYVLVYTPLKRRTPLALLIGAVPGAMPPLIGWVAASGRLQPAAIALFGVIFVWQVPHFLAIALFRSRDYAAAGLKVVPAVHGEPAARRMIVRYLVLQVLVTLSLVPLGIGDTRYLVVTTLLGGAMLAWGLLGLRRSAGLAWARGLFLASLVYLPAVFVLLLL